MVRKLIGREQSSGGDPVGGAEWTDSGRRLGFVKALFGTAGTVTTAPAPPPPPPGTGALSTNFGLLSTNAGTLPFTIGHYFKDGDVGPTQDIAVTGANAQVVKHRTFPSGNLRHATISGTYSSTANVTATVGLAIGTASTGTALTAADIATANPSATFQVVGTGTLTLSSLLGSPTGTWISGHKMVHCWYRSDFAGFEVTFDVQHYGSRTNVLVSWTPLSFLSTTDRLSLGSRSAVTAHVVVAIGGVTLLDETAENPPNAGACVEGWIGGDPLVVPFHNRSYLNTTALMPAQTDRAIDGAVLAGIATGYGGVGIPATEDGSGLAQTYVPHQGGGWSQFMSRTGYQAQVGIYPNWDCTWLACGDPRAYNSIIVNAKSLRSYRIDFRDPNTRDVIKPNTYATWTINGPGANADSNTIWGSGDTARKFEINHCGSVALAYALTGHRYHYETMMLAQGSMTFLTAGFSGQGTQRIVYQEDRGTAWSMRNLGQVSALARDGDTIADEYRQMCSWNYQGFDFLRVRFPQPYTALTGLERIYPAYALDNSEIAPWQVHYMAAVHGANYDLQPFATTDTLGNAAMLATRNAVYAFPVMLGGQMGDVTQYPIAYASQYSVFLKSAGGAWATNGGEVFTDTLGVYNTSSGNTLFGGSASAPVAAWQGPWGAFNAALVAAVNHGFPGASAAYTRLTTFVGWQSLAVPGFNLIPLWSTVPRTTAAPSSPTFAGPNISNISGTSGVSLPPVDVSGKFVVPAGGGVFSKSAAGTAWPTDILVSSGGTISGTPGTIATTTGVKVRVSDTFGRTADSNAFNLTIAAPAPPPPTGSPGWYVTLAGMADGTWMQIPGSSMFGVNPDPQNAQNGSPQNRVDDWNSMVLNRTNGEMRNPGNGGHADWQGNEVMVNNLLRSNVVSWNWSYERQPAPQQYATLDAVPHNLLGEKPSSHTYWTVFDTQDGYITCLGVDAVWGSGNVGDAHTLHKFDTRSKAWVGSGSATNTVFSGIDLDAMTKGGMARHQITGEIYFTSALYDSVRIFNPANNSVRWGSNTIRGSRSVDYSPCAIDHTRGHVVWFGNNFVDGGGRLHLIASNTAAEFNFTGPAAEVFTVAYHGGNTAGRCGYAVHFDATLGGGQGRYVVKTKVSGEVVLVRPPGLGPSGEDWYCERLSTSGNAAMPTLISIHIVANRFLPLDMPDGRTVYVYEPNEAQNIWVIRPPLS